MKTHEEDEEEDLVKCHLCSKRHDCKVGKPKLTEELTYYVDMVPEEWRGHNYWVMRQVVITHYKCPLNKGLLSKEIQDKGSDWSCYYLTEIYNKSDNIDLMNEFRKEMIITDEEFKTIVQVILGRFKYRDQLQILCWTTVFSEEPQLFVDLVKRLVYEL